MFRDAYLDELIDAWHDGDDTMPLPEFLGVTSDEYKQWVETGYTANTPLRDKLVREGLALFLDGTGNPDVTDQDEEQPGHEEGTTPTAA
jgi:hypothetical protein